MHWLPLLVRKPGFSCFFFVMLMAQKLHTLACHYVDSRYIKSLYIYIYIYTFSDKNEKTNTEHFNWRNGFYNIQNKKRRLKERKCIKSQCWWKHCLLRFDGGALGFPALSAEALPLWVFLLAAAGPVITGQWMRKIELQEFVGLWPNQSHGPMPSQWKAFPKSKTLINNARVKARRSHTNGLLLLTVLSLSLEI